MCPLLKRACGVAVLMNERRLPESLIVPSNIAHHYDERVLFRTHTILAKPKLSVAGQSLVHAMVRLGRSSDDGEANKHGKRDGDATIAWDVVLASDR